MDSRLTSVSALWLLPLAAAEMKISVSQRRMCECAELYVGEGTKSLPVNEESLAVGLIGGNEL